jgi:hypothetical protein
VQAKKKGNALSSLGIGSPCLLMQKKTCEKPHLFFPAFCVRRMIAAAYSTAKEKKKNEKRCD